jgi:Response regulator containing CheY-like receiver and SARP domains
MKKRILLIDQQEKNVTILKKSLSKSQDYELEVVQFPRLVASSACCSPMHPGEVHQLVEYVLYNDFDIIFIHLDDASINGLGIYRELQKEFPYIKKVFMSHSESHALTAFEEHADAFLPLPATRESIHAVFERLIYFENTG